MFNATSKARLSQIYIPRSVESTRLTLSDEESNADAGHVEAVQPRLNVEPDMLGVARPFPFEDTLCDCCDGRVVSCLDGLEHLCELFVVLLDLRRPGDVVGVCVVSREKAEKSEWE